MTTPQFRHLITLSLAAAVLFWAPIVEAQSAADAKRTIGASPPRKALRVLNV